MAAYKSAGLAPLVIWAATVEPAEVPMTRSASVTSMPASASPAMRPSSQALPARPAGSPCGFLVSMGVAVREWRVDGSGDGRRWSAHDGPMPDEPSTGPRPETYVWPLVALGVVILPQVLVPARMREGPPIVVPAIEATVVLILLAVAAKPGPVPRAARPLVLSLVFFNDTATT